MQEEPIMDVAHLGHLELLTPKPEESLRFFVDVMGMTESGTRGESVFLRGWDDYERYSLKLTGSRTSGMGHAAFRARSPQALQRRVAALKESGQAVGWHEGELGHGPAFQFRDPDGHLLEIYYETEWYEAPRRYGPHSKTRRSASQRAASTSGGSITSTAWPPTSRPTASSSNALSDCGSLSRSCSTTAPRSACG